MAWTKAKTAAVVGVAVLLTTGTTLIAVKVVNSARTAAHPIQGNWAGTLETRPGVKLRLVLKLAGANGTYHATMDSLDQGAKDIPVNKVVYRYPSVSVEMPAINGMYKATLNSGATEISGAWSQGGRSWPLVLKRTADASAVPEPLAETDYAPRKDSDLQGFWQGTLKAGNTSLRLNLRIAEATDGTFRAEFDSVDQGAKGLPVTSLTYTKPAMRFELGAVGGGFDGIVDDSDTTITGTWTQSGRKLPLTFKRAEPDTGQAQEGEKSFSYASSSDLPGHWNGTLDGQKFKLRLVVNIARMTDGSFSATMDSPDQGAGGIPATAVQFTAPKVRIEWKGIGGTYDGTLKDGKLSGTWRQGGKTFPLVLERRG